MARAAAAGVRQRGGVGWVYKLLTIAYVGAVILFSYRAGLTVIAKGVGGCVGLAFLYQLASRGDVRVPLTYKFWAAWFVVALVATFRADYMELAVFKTFSLLMIVPVAFMITKGLLWNRATGFYRVGLIGAGLISCGMVWLSPATFSGIDGRVFGPLGDANEFGTVLVTTFLLASIGAFGVRGPLAKAASLVAALVLFVMIVKTGSRMALLGSLAGFATMLFLLVARARTSHSLRVLLPLIIGVVVLTVGAIYIAKSGYWFRMEAALSVLEAGDVKQGDTSLQGRVYLYKRALEVALDNPLVGIGLDNFRGVEGLQKGSHIGTWTHSNYMEVLVSTGFMGFILYFYIYWAWIRQMLRSRELIYETRSFGPYASVVTVFIAFAAMDVFLPSYSQKFFWLVAAWIAAEIEMMREASHQRLENRQRGIATA